MKYPSRALAENATRTGVPPVLVVPARSKAWADPAVNAGDVLLIVESFATWLFGAVS